jgi:hypothetical protein
VAELSAADLLLQLSVDGAGGDDQVLESSSATTYSSRRSASPSLEDLAAQEEVDRVEKRVVEEPAVSTELDVQGQEEVPPSVVLSDLYAGRHLHLQRHCRAQGGRTTTMTGRRPPTRQGH